MIYDNLPIYRAALDLCVYIETIVKSFDKYHKYTIGEDLRNHSKKVLFLIHKANVSKENRIQMLELLRDRCEETKMLLALGKELKAFKSFKQFEYSSKLSVAVCRQSQAWLQNSMKYLARVSV